MFSMMEGSVVSLNVFMGRGEDHLGIMVGSHVEFSMVFDFRLIIASIVWLVALVGDLDEVSLVVWTVRAVRTISTVSLGDRESPGGSERALWFRVAFL